MAEIPPNASSAPEGSGEPPASAGSDQPNQTGAPAGPQAHILVAIADPAEREAVQLGLRPSFSVAVVADLEPARVLLREWRPDLLVVSSDGLDALALLRAMRGDETTHRPPALLLASSLTEQARSLALGAGADDILLKPFGNDELLTRVMSLLHLGSLRQTAAQKASATEARLERLVSILPAGIYAVDAEGRITFFNPRAAEIWGRRPALGASYEEFAAAFRILAADGDSFVALDERPMSIALREGRAYRQQEVVMERPDGSRFQTNFSIDPTFGADGRVNGAIAVFQDVTHQRAAQAALHATQERYRAVFQQASVGIFECDLTGRIVRTNAALQQLSGYSDAELQGMNWRDLVPPDELQGSASIAESLRRGRVGSFSAERRFRRKNGTFGWVDVFATLIRTAQNHPSHALAVVVDITTRKRAEAQLRETEARFRMAADNAPVLIWIADRARRCTWVNQPWLDFVGRPLAAELGHGWTESIHIEDRDRVLRIADAAFAANERFSAELRLRRHDGEYRWLLTHGVPRREGSDFVGYIGSCIDITDRRRAEEAMHESRNAERARRQELEVLNQVAPAAIWIAHDRECRHVTRNAAAATLLRLDTTSATDDAFVNPSREVQVYRRGKPVAVDELPLRRAARTGESVLDQELEFRGQDGTSHWAYGSATPLFDEVGEVRGAICVLVDLTTRRQAEAALRQSEEQLRLVTDHASVSIAQIDRNLRYRFANRAYAERYGRQPHELIGRRLVDIAGEEAVNPARPQIERALAGERVEFEMHLPVSGGVSRFGSIAFVPERDGQGLVVGFVAVIADITQRKRAELELERARDEAVAASRAKDDFLAALSHELRTPLSPVLLLASENASDPKLPPAIRADFEAIRKSVELEARLIDDLLDLTRIVRNSISLDTRPVDIPVVLRDALITVHAELRAKEISLVLDLAPEPQWVVGDPVRLQQVFWNVFKNAVKFTPEQGRVTLTTRAEPQRGVVAIEVADTGIGLTSAEIERVFEAFAQGDHAAHGGSHRFGGLGLGLAISRRVVELHHGTIVARSAGRDHGAAFRIELPLLQRPAHDRTHPTAAPDASAAAAAPETDAGGLRVLLVEDHAPTRSALESLLRRRHYRVLSAANVAEALQLAEQHRFDLLISDIGLPDGSGHDVMKDLHARFGLPGIALTGYGMEEDIARSRAAGFALHLTKPVRVQNLDRALADLSLESGKH